MNVKKKWIIVVQKNAGIPRENVIIITAENE